MGKYLDPFKGALFTALWAFLAQVIILSVGWLQSVAAWASASGHAPLPGLSTIGYAIVAAFTSAMAGVVSFAVRAVQANGVKVPGLPAPTYGSPPVLPVQPVENGDAV